MHIFAAPGSRRTDMRKFWLAIGLCVLATAGASAQTLTTLYSFCAQTNCSDGEDPSAPLAQGTDGNFYGTTYTTAIDNGTVFKITPSGGLTTLYTFTGSTDGGYPVGALTLTTGGVFYGTTSEGTAFKITSAGNLTTLITLDGPPEAGLLQATDGNFYGTTVYGGLYGFGTIFRMTASGAVTYIYNFCSQDGCTDGAEPQAALIQGTDGNLYGTTTVGGTGGGNDCSLATTGCGTVFKITLEGALTTLYSFCSHANCSDGAFPHDSLAQDAEGNLYGTTRWGGTGLFCPIQGPGCGTVFKITRTGKLTTLHSFCKGSTCSDGDFPLAGLALGTDGNLYGTTPTGVVGAPSVYGTIFKITPSGALTTLYTFCSQPNCTDGYDPDVNLMQATNGSFYGTTPYGGSNGYGTVFSLSVGLGAFVQSVPTSGKAGATVVILGTNLAGASAVTFNGVPVESFTINSTGTAVTTSVPSGASTGYIKVTTPSGSLTSNIAFDVP
jgi:uncharacterized repeat protein (TIGR03803 family)